MLFTTKSLDIRLGFDLEPTPVSFARHPWAQVKWYAVQQPHNLRPGEIFSRFQKGSANPPDRSGALTVQVSGHPLFLAVARELWVIDVQVFLS